MKDMNQAELVDSQESMIKTQNQLQNQTQNSADLTNRVNAIQKLLAEHGADVPADEIKSGLEELINVYKVPAAEAQRSTTNAFLKKYNISKSKVFTGKGSAVTKKAAEISAMAAQPDTWVNFKGKVIQLWESSHESIAQAGLAGDETGVVKFTLWTNAGMEPLELNKTYDFKNVVVKTWNGKTSIDLNKAAAVTISDEEMTVIKSDIAADSKDKTNEMRTVAELKTDGMWTDLKANIVQLFENTHESIAFAGILGDETGTMRFTVWKTSFAEQPEAGKSYKISNAIVKEWNGNFALEINRAGKIEEINEEIVAKSAAFVICGCAVDIQAGSGLIRRCPECGKVMAKGMCTEHGKLKGRYDLRIKAVFDDGTNAHETIINCELTQKLLDMTLEDAVLMATETLDPDCVNDLIKKEFVGKYYAVKGAKTDRYIIAESVEKAEPADFIKVSELKEKISAELETATEENIIETAQVEPVSNSDLEEFEKMLDTVADEEIESCFGEPDDFEKEIFENDLDDIEIDVDGIGIDDIELEEIDIDNIDDTDADDSEVI